MIEQLHGLAAEIASVIGEDETLALLTSRGGTEINIPAEPSGSALEALVGLDAAEALVDHFGVTKITLPCGHLRGQRGRRARGVRLLLAGRSTREVALACDVHDRTVDGWRQGLVAQGSLGPQDAQPRLPLGDR